MNPHLIHTVFYLAAVAPPNEGNLHRFEFTEPHMGTRFQITLYAPNDGAAQKARRAAFARIAELDTIMSDYRPTSELMQLCRKFATTIGDPVPVSKDLFTVLSLGQSASQLSDGAFDVTVGPLSKLWRRSRRTQQLPDSEELASALRRVGYRKVKLDEKTRSVQLLTPGMLLDLGGIAKGYAADASLEVLKNHGMSRALVAAGGDIAVGEAPPGKAGWTIGIAPLNVSEKPPKRFLLLHHAAVSTSGDAEQYVEIAGKRYSHLLNPHTGLGLVGRLSVTVVARRGVQADSLTKAVSILGPEKGMKIIDTLEGVAASFVRQTDQGEETIDSRRFASYLTPPGR